MALDVYFGKDIENALRSTEHSVRGLLEELEKTNEEYTKEYAKGYRKGHNAALAAIALAFGLMDK